MMISFWWCSLVVLYCTIGAGSVDTEPVVLPRVYDATVQVKSIVTVHTSEHEAWHGVNRLTVARFRVAFKHELYYRKLEVFSLRAWAGNIFTDRVVLQCDNVSFNVSNDDSGMMIGRPRILDMNKGAMHLIRFIESMAWFSEPTDGSTLPILEGYLILSRGVLGSHRQRLSPSAVHTCHLRFIDERMNSSTARQQHYFHDGSHQRVGGLLGFRQTPAFPLKTLPRGVFYRALRHYEHFETAPGNNDDDGTTSFIEEEEDKTGLRQNTVGWHRVYDMIGAIAPSFLEMTTKVHHTMKSEARSTQIFAAIIDPIIQQVPPVVAQMLVELMTPPVIDLLYPILSDLLMGIFKPDSTFGVWENTYATVEDIPIGGVPVTVPIDGVATQLLERMNSGAQEVEYPVFLDLAHTMLFAAPPSIFRIIKQKIGTNVANQVLEDDMRETVDLLDQSLSSAMRQEVNRTVSRGLIQSLTLSLTRAVSRSEISFLCYEWSKSLLRIPNSQLTRLLTYTLTPQLGLILHHTLTRNPITDYQCYFCKWHNIYCWACAAALSQDYYKDVYTNYYAHYYANYFGWRYSHGLIHDFFIDNYHNHNPWPPGKHVMRTDIDMTGTKNKPILAPGHEYNDDPGYGDMDDNQSEKAGSYS